MVKPGNLRNRDEDSPTTCTCMRKPCMEVVSYSQPHTPGGSWLRETSGWDMQRRQKQLRFDTAKVVQHKCIHKACAFSHTPKHMHVCALGGVWRAVLVSYLLFAFEGASWQLETRLVNSLAN